MGLRGLEVGVDTRNYFEHFKIVSNASNFNFNKLHRSLDIEYGFIGYLRFISLFSKSYIICQLLTSFVICGILVKFLNEFSITPLLSLLIVLPEVYLLGFNIQRQMIASVIILMAFIYYNRKKISLSIILFCIAFSFHFTSIFALPIFFMNKLRKYTIILKLIPLLLIAFILLFHTIFPIFLELNLYTNYMDNHKVVHQAGGIKLLWAFEVICCLCILYSHKDRKQHKVFACLGLVSICTNIVGLEFNYFERLGVFYLPFLAVAVPMITTKFKGNFKLIVQSFIVFLYSAYFALSIGGQYSYSFF